MKPTGPNPFTVALALAMLLCPALRATADDACPAQSGVADSELWRAFARQTEADYLLPRGLHKSELSPEQWARILGHSLGRQARHVGIDPRRRALFSCLEVGVAETLADLSEAYGALPGDAPADDGALGRSAEEATIGFYDEEISRLTGVEAGELATSIFGEAIPVPSSRVGGQGDEAMVAGAAAVLTRCRFNLHPSLYTGAHPAYTWYLIRRPMRGGGYFYDTLEVPPTWGADHPKRPENRPRPDQAILVTGSKREILDRIGELRATCR